MEPASQNRHVADPSAPDDQQTWTVRTAHRPAIICPSWCVVPEAAHLDQLASLDGNVLHTSDWLPADAAGGLAIQLSAAHLIDGTPDPDDPETRVRLSPPPEEGYALTQATTLAAQLAARLVGLQGTH